MFPFSRTPKTERTFPVAARLALAVAVGGALVSCSSPAPSKARSEVVVSVADQKMGLYSGGKLTKQFVVSTSKFGLGDRPGSNCTPLGRHEIIAKIGHGLPPGAVLKSRSWNGEVLKPNAPGRDPIVSRILWLRGLETSNRNAMNRFIYIHGTPEEARLGSPASYGCIRMGMKDVVEVFNQVSIGAKVVVTKDHLPKGEVDKEEERRKKEAAEALLAEAKKKADDEAAAAKAAGTEAPATATPPAPQDVAPAADPVKDKTASAEKVGPEAAAPVAKAKSTKKAGSSKSEKVTTSKRSSITVAKAHG